MRTVINHRVYDSATAELVYTAETPAGCETLYRKRTGEYFLLDADYQIVPLDYDDARDWAISRMSSDAYEREFEAYLNEAAGDVHVSIMMPAYLYALVASESRRTGRSKSSVVCSAIQHEFS